MRDRRVRFALLLAGLRWRLWSSLAMFVVALFGVGVGAFGPIFLNSADQSILNATLNSAPPGNAGLTLQASTGNGSSHALASAGSSIPAAAKDLFGRPISTSEAGLNLFAQDQPYAATLMSRTDVCGHIEIVAGRCSESAGTVVMSTRSAQLIGANLGGELRTTLTGSATTASFLIVGLYEAGNPSDPYWWGSNPFSFGESTPMKPLLDTVFTGASSLLSSVPRSLISYQLQFPYRPGALSVADIGNLEALLRGYRQTALKQHDVEVSTQLLSLLSQATSIEHTTATIVAVVDLQLVLLAVFVLYFVSARTAAEREPDVKLAMLRGFRPRSALAVALAEPAAAVAVAVPVGLLLAWLVALIGAVTFFGSGIGASITLLAVGAAILTGIAGLGAVAIGSSRSVVSSDVAVEAGPSGVPVRRSSWRLVGDVAAVSVGAAAFVELALSGVASATGSSRSDPLAAFAPGLLALALGVIGARLLPGLLRRTFRFTAYSKRVGLSLATRRVARRAEFGAQVMIVTLAVALGSFAVSGWAIARRNRAVMSEFEVGAAKVLTVNVRPGVNFLSAVRRADPSGRFAMAAVVENASDGTTLAVDSSRMRPIMSWPAGLGAGGEAQVARALVPSGVAPSVNVSGSDLRVMLATTVDPQPHPVLSVDLFDEGFQTPQQVVLGSLVPGSSTYEASIEGLCPSGCRLEDLSLVWAPPVVPTSASAGAVKFEVSSLAVRANNGGWSNLAAGISRSGRWTSGGGALLTYGSEGLGVSAGLDPFGSPTRIGPDDVPSQLPAVETTTAYQFAQTPGQPLALVGLDGGTVAGRFSGEVPALPRVGATASLVDLEMAERFLSGPSVNDTTEVWLSADAPASVFARLGKRGITITSVDSVAAREHASIHGGTEQAYTLFLISAIAAAALAIGVTGFTVVAGARRREGELAALLAVGISSAHLRRSLLGEQALVLGTATVLGAGSGLVAAAVAFKSVPEFVALGPGPPLELGLPGVLLVSSLCAFAVLLALTVSVGASLVVRAASADKISGAQA